MTRLSMAMLLPSIFIFVVGCGKQGPSVSNAAACVDERMGAQSFDSSVRRFMVKRRSSGVQTQGLQPSGEPVREYRVSGVHVSIEAVDDQWDSIELKQGETSTLLQELMSDENVEFIEPDFVIESLQETAVATRTTAIADTWAHLRVNTPRAWQMSQGSERIVVAVIDGGVDVDHQDLKGNIWQNPRETLNGRDDDGNGKIDDVVGWDFANGDNNPRSDKISHFHGTHVAGIVGAMAHTGRAASGFAPKVRIMPLKYIQADGRGNTSNAIKAIDYAIRMKAHIINASWTSPSYSRALHEAFVRARNAGILVIASGGNFSINNDKTPHYPASLPLDNIISVAASTTQDSLASFSDYGATSVDFAAPGTSIVSTKNGGTYATMSGTSMAAPLVTGIAVLIKARHLNFGYQQIAQALFQGVEKLSAMKGKVKFGGRVNAYRSLLAADQLADGGLVEAAQNLANVNGGSPGVSLGSACL